ncbi:MAG TPA: Hsp20/alpha crystallin family protein [Candidatus Paceibacterota bacterium]|nr:Hsp20/alpha crystallin family protein [Candidatus Paceibacterota bacterium]
MTIPPLKKKSFFERLAGNLGFDDSDDFEDSESVKIERKNNPLSHVSHTPQKEEQHIAHVEAAAELAVDVYQTANDIVIQAIIAGTSPENLSINITRDSVTVKGKREENRTVVRENYITKELFWGSFIRTVQLPAEVEIDAAEAICKNGMLLIKLPKLDKYRQTSIKVKTI